MCMKNKQLPLKGSQGKKILVKTYFNSAALQALKMTKLTSWERRTPTCKRWSPCTSQICSSLYQTFAVRVWKYSQSKRSQLNYISYHIMYTRVYSYHIISYHTSIRRWTPDQKRLLFGSNRAFHCSCEPDANEVFHAIMCFKQYTRNTGLPTSVHGHLWGCRCKKINFPFQRILNRLLI